MGQQVVPANQPDRAAIEKAVGHLHQVMVDELDRLKGENAQLKVDKAAQQAKLAAQVAAAEDTDANRLEDLKARDEEIKRLRGVINEQMAAYAEQSRNTEQIRAERSS
jgi:hypothetical protein